MPHSSQLPSRARRGRKELQRRPARRPALGVEQLEDRVVPTVVFRPLFGAESLSASPPFNVLDSPTVYFIFWGNSWAPGQPGAATEQGLLGDAVKIIQGPYLSGLQEYSSDGRAAYGGAWVDASSVPPAGFDPGALNEASNFAAVQGEIQRAIDTPGSSIPAPGAAPSLRQVPVYVVVTDPAHSADDQGGWNTPGTYVPPGPSAQGVPIHMIAAGTGTGGQGLENEFDLTVSHELAETVSDPLEDGSGVEVQPPAGFPAALAPAGQVADNEPVEYGYRLGGPGGPLGQAYWSAQAAAFIVPDGNPGRVELDPTPGWTMDPANGIYYFRPLYDLTLRGDQLGTSGPATITIDATASGTTVTVLGSGASPNPQTFFYDPGTIRAINVEPGPGGDTIDVEELTAGQTVNIDGTGRDTVNVGAAGSLAGFLGAVSVSGRSGSVTLNVDDSQDGTGQAFIQGAGPATGTYTLSRRGRGTVTYAAAAVHALTLRGGRGGNTFYLEATAPGSTTTVDTGSGSDLIDVRSTSGPLDVVSSGSDPAARQARDTVLVGNPTLAGRTLAAVAGAIDVSNGAGTTALVVDDSGDAGGLDLTLTGQGLGPTPGTRGPAAISYGPGVAALRFRAGGGKNAFRVLGTGPATTIDAGTGNDAVTVGDAGHNLRAVDGLTVIGNGHTTLTVDDRGNLPAPAASPRYVPVATRYVVTGGKLARTALAGVGPGGPSLPPSSTVISYQSLAGLTINGGPAAPTAYQIDGTGGTAAFTVNAANADTVTVGEPRGALDAVGSVTVNGSRRTSLTVNDGGTARSEEYAISSAAITRAPLTAPASAPTQTITYANLAGVTVRGGQGADLFAVTGTPAGTAVALAGGPGPNRFLVGGPLGNLDSIQGPLALHGGSHADLAVVNDSANATAHRYSLADNGVGRNGMAPISYDSLGEVELFTRSTPARGSGPDTVNVLGTAFNALTVVAVGAGAAVTLGAPSGRGPTHTLQDFRGALRVETPASQPATVTIDDAGHVGPTGNPYSAARTVTFARDPHAGYLLAGLAAQPIYLQVGTGSSVSIRGDAGNERFVLQSLPPGVRLSIDGGGGTNTLDYSAYAGNATVDLALGTATGLMGGIGNIQNVIGSAGNDVLVGGSVPDTLVGGTGRDILIGGGGTDRLTGGGGDDILIGGTTSYDREPADLALLLREWLQPSSFAARKAALAAGTDLLAGTGVKLDRTTVQPNGAPDVVFPGPGNNWILP